MPPNLINALKSPENRLKPWLVLLITTAFFSIPAFSVDHNPLSNQADLDLQTPATSNGPDPLILELSPFHNKLKTLSPAIIRQKDRNTASKLASSERIALILASAAFSARAVSALPDENQLEASSEPSGLHPTESVELFRNQNKSAFTRLKRAELLSLASQLAGYMVMDLSDVWKDPDAPPGTRWENLKHAWRTAPTWDDDGYGYNYIGHPYTGAFTYNLMRSQGSSALVSWLFSYSQSLIWEYTLEATVEHPSIQDMLITPNVGSLLGEAAHRLTGKMRENGLSRKEKFLITILNPGYILNNGYH